MSIFEDKQKMKEVKKKIAEIVRNKMNKDMGGALIDSSLFEIADEIVNLIKKESV